MLPGGLTLTRGQRDTGVEISQGKPLEISDEIWMYNPNERKALGWFLSQRTKQNSGRRTFGHLEDAPLSNWVQYTGADESSQNTTEAGGFILDSESRTRVTVGTRVAFPDINEILRIKVALDGSSGSVTRNWGRGTSACLLKHGMKGHILPPSMIEGFTTGEGITNALYYKSFEMSEVSYPVQVTFPEEAEESRAGSPFERGLAKTIDQAKEQIQAELFFSAQKLDSSTFAHPAGSAEGLDNYISTHVYIAKKLSRMDFFDILTEWQMFNKIGGAIMCSLPFKNQVTQWAMDSTQYTVEVGSNPDGTTFGLVIDRVKWTVGEFDLIDVDLLNQHPNLLGRVYFCPVGHYSYRPLVGPRENLDIKYRPIERDEVHAHEGEIYGMYGHEFFEEERWAKLTGLQFTG